MEALAETEVYPVWGSDELKSMRFLVDKHRNFQWVYSLYDRSRKDLLIDGCTAQWWQGTTVSAQIGYSGNCKLFRSIHALVFRRCKVKFIMSERVNRRSNWHVRIGQFHPLPLTIPSSLCQMLTNACSHLCKELPKRIRWELVLAVCYRYLYWPEYTRLLQTVSNAWKNVLIPMSTMLLQKVRQFSM